MNTLSFSRYNSFCFFYVFPFLINIVMHNFLTFQLPRVLNIFPSLYFSLILFTQLSMFLNGILLNLCKKSFENFRGINYNFSINEFNPLYGFYSGNNNKIIYVFRNYRYNFILYHKVFSLTKIYKQIIYTCIHLYVCV